jgi:NADPH:quinone reductase-like Zn-dependent oxidoreductase
MKAICIHRYGGPEELVDEDLPVPEPRENELLVRVCAAGVNPADRQIRAGLRGRLREPFTWIPGAEVSGVVERTGQGTTDFRIGDEVYGRLAGFGGYAEYAVAEPAAGVSRKPASLDHVMAAALPVAALTAWDALIGQARLAPGQRVLIHAAAGGVGHIAVQLAKWKGATVIATASGKNEAFLWRLGVDTFIDYRTARFEDVIQDVDVVLDAIPCEVDDAADALHAETIRRSWRVLRDNGVLVTLGAVGAIPRLMSEGAAARGGGVRAAFANAQPRRDQLDRISELVDAGHIVPAVSTVLPLAEAREAHRLIQTGHTTGKIVLRIGDSRCTAIQG